MDMMELMKWLPDGEKDRLIELEKTFSTPGWATIVEWAQDANKASILRAAYAKSWPESRIAFGQSLAYEEVITMAARILTEYANLAEANRLQSEADDANSGDYE